MSTAVSFRHPRPFSFAPRVRTTAEIDAFFPVDALAEYSKIYGLTIDQAEALYFNSENIPMPFVVDTVDLSSNPDTTVPDHSYTPSTQSVVSTIVPRFRTTGVNAAGTTTLTVGTNDPVPVDGQTYETLVRLWSVNKSLVFLNSETGLYTLGLRFTWFYTLKFSNYTAPDYFWITWAWRISNEFAFTLNGDPSMFKDLSFMGCPVRIYGGATVGPFTPGSGGVDSISPDLGSTSFFTY